MIDDVLYYINEDMPRSKIYKILEKLHFDMDAAVDRIFQMKEQKQKKKDKKKSNMKEKIELEKELEPEKVPWPSSKKKETESVQDGKNLMRKSGEFEMRRSRRDSVNIEIKRKESKKINANFKEVQIDKTFWNCPYPTIQYPE